jgi:glycoside/pentoside/hexuronide:cation symporter, GPH family
MQATNLRRKLVYGSGAITFALKDAAFAIFVLFYYKQVLGLSGTLTGLAIALSVLWDAISDPLVGAWSDRLRSRWGRRHPLMVASVLPLALSFIALFWPPQQVLGSQLTLFYWLLGTVLMLRTALTLFMVPYLALGAEISSDYHERTSLANARTNLAWFVGVLVPATSLAFLFTSDNGIDGRFIVSNYQRYGLLSALGVICASWICLRGTWGYIPTLPKVSDAPGNGLWRDIRDTFRNRNFRWVVSLETIIGGIGGIIATLLMVYYTYFWQLDTAEISFLFAGPPLLAVLLVTISSRFVNKRLEKQQLLSLSCIGGALNLLWLTPLALMDVLPQDHMLVLALISLNWMIHIAFVIIRTVSAFSLLADIADEQDLSTGKRQEGVMFAAAFFAAKFISGLGYLVAGPFLDLIGLQAGMQPGETPPSVFWGLGLVMGPGLALTLMIPAWMTFKIDLNMKSQQETQQALRSRDHV